MRTEFQNKDMKEEWMDQKEDKVRRPLLDEVDEISKKGDENFKE